MKMHLSFSDADPKIDPRAYPLIGQIIVRWARFEYLLDFDIRAMLQIPRFKRRKMLRPFAKRLELWRDLNHQHYTKSPDHISITDSIFESATLASKRRNVLTHGYWGEFDNSVPDVFVFITLDSKKGKMLLIRHDVTIGGLEELDALIARTFAIESKYLLHRKTEGSIPTMGRFSKPIPQPGHPR